MRTQTLVTLNRTIKVQHLGATHDMLAFTGEWMQHLRDDSAKYRILYIHGPKAVTFTGDQPIVALRKSTIVAEQELGGAQKSKLYYVDGQIDGHWWKVDSYIAESETEAIALAMRDNGNRYVMYRIAKTEVLP